MRIGIFLTATVAAVLASGLSSNAAADGAVRRPNLLVIVADDLGWSDLGSFGGEVATPTLDGLALSGVRFSGFHTAPACSPTRAMLLSGVDSHRVGLGTMAELPNQGTRGAPGYETYLNDRVASIADLLRVGGYLTVMTGKWHLGLTPEREPAARGFEHSFALLEGASNHFGADQGPAWADAGLAPSYRDDGKAARLPDGAYSSDYFVDQAGKAGDDRPFFAYLSFTAPHWPLQAPAETIAKYGGRYDAGYDALREARLARQRRLGLIPSDAAPHAIEMTRPWNALAPEEKALEARKMEVYAAMVDRMDQAVGRLVAELKRLGRYDETVILFLADNGPAGNARSTPDPRRRTEPDPILGIDNRLANIGSASSYVSYGPGWAQANSTPSRLMKGYTTEGGIRVVAFAAGVGVAGGGRVVDANLDVRDVAPTLLDLAGLSQPDRFGGRPILQHQGHSLRPVLSGQAASIRPANEPLGYELSFHRALRKGDWKAVRRPTPDGAPVMSAGEGRWQLFNIARDPGETEDLAGTEPAKLRELIADYDAYARSNGVAAPPGRPWP